MRSRLKELPRHGDFVSLVLLLVVIGSVWGFVEIADAVREGELRRFGRRGARPFNLQEMRKFYMKPDGTVWTVTNRPPGPARNTAPAASTWLAALWTLLGTGFVLGGLVLGGVRKR